MELIRYLICGIATTIVSVGTFYAAAGIIGTNTTLGLQLCNVLSWVLAVLFSFVVSKRWVFQTKGKFVSFAGCRMLTLVCDMGIMELLIMGYGLDYKISKWIAQIIVTVLNYIFGKLIVFRKHEVKMYIHREIKK